MRPGRRLGIDVGDARVGVAVSDPDALLATPVESVTRDLAEDVDVVVVAGHAREHGVVEIVVGLPRGLDGGEGPAALKARSYAGKLAMRLPDVPIRLLDERLSTVDAHRALREAGRSMRRHRPVVDQQAAVVILQTALDLERATGRPPGVPLHSRKPRSKRRRDVGSET